VSTAEKSKTALPIGGNGGEEKYLLFLKEAHVFNLVCFIVGKQCTWWWPHKIRWGGPTKFGESPQKLAFKFCNSCKRWKIWRNPKIL